MTAEASCQLYAVVEAGPGALERVAAALAAASVAVLLVAPAPGADGLDASAARPLVAAAQAAGIPALILADARLARTLRADGVHLPASGGIVDDYEEAREILGARGVIGADAGISRDDAMSLAEAGADYVAFGAPRDRDDRDDARAHRDELVAWWAEIFQVPCVAFDVEDAAEAEALAAVRTDFVAVTLAAGTPIGDVRDLVAGVAAAVRHAASAS